MLIFSWNQIEDFIIKSELPDIFKSGTAITVGNFDGPHIGHKSLFDNVLDFAKKNNLAPGVVMFKQSIGYFKNQGKYDGDVSTLAQRLKVIEREGICFVILIDFSIDFGKMKGRDFLSMLVHGSAMKFIVEGYDFHCGYKGDCGMDEISAFAKENKIFAKFEEPVFFKDERVSSSLIRSKILDGNFKDVFCMLGRNYLLDCESITWSKDDKYFTACKKMFLQATPMRGVYNVNILLPNKKLHSCLLADAHNLRLEYLPVNASQISAIEFI